MPTTIKRVIVTLALATLSTTAAAASFTYQGNLNDAGKPANGNYDLQLTLYSAPQGGQVVGGPLIVYKVPVHNGTFSTQIDFGPVPNPAGSVWLGVQVRRAGIGSFAALDARSPVDVADIATTTGSVCPGAWTIAGNAGNPVGSYLGTADNNPLIFDVNGSQAGSLSPTADATYTDAPNVVFGSSSNNVTGAIGATIGGGGSSNATKCGVGANQSCLNTAGDFGTVGGGRGNSALSIGNSDNTVGGGDGNLANGNGATVAGGLSNISNSGASTVGGGVYNTASSLVSTVGGGKENTASGQYSIVGGGYFNTASGTYSTVAGGYENFASANSSFAAGTFASVRASDTGTFVWSDSAATSAFTSTGVNQFLINAHGGVGIGTNNPNGYQLRVVAPAAGIRGETSNGYYWAVSGNNSGGSGNGAGVYGASASTAGYGLAGYASASGGVGTLGYTTAEGGFGVVASNQAHGVALTVQGDAATSGVLISTSVGAYLSSGGQWVNKSDRAAKSGFQSIDVGHILDEVVALPVTRWFYKTEGDSIHHIGPVAQDFHAAFDLGRDDKTIGTVDEGGIALAAIQGLNKKLEADNAELRARSAELQAESASLHQELYDLIARVKRLENSKEK